MKYLPTVTLGLLVLCAACSGETETSPEGSPSSYQAISALGDTLYAPALADSVQQQYETQLAEARTAYENHPDSANALIWYARRTAYLGKYREAIRIFTQGVEAFPDDARFYRHRGHRYITTRQFDKAISDLTQATEMIQGTADEVEPDGLPNDRNTPRSTLHTNVWYHLGLAQYLQGDFEAAASSFDRTRTASPNDDMRVASTHWEYLSLRRAGKDLEAGNLLESISQDMDVIENEDYHKLLMVYKGNFEEKSLLTQTDNPLRDATIGYGLGNWHYINGREERAKQLLQSVYDGSQWNAFGYIAAERDLRAL